MSRLKDARQQSHLFDMSNIKIRVNGRGNAWPIVLGQEHPFYNRQNYQDLANASFSILKSALKEPNEKEIEWDLMIDAGHGTVQYLLQNCNRIPEAVFLTHPHIDHTLGLDWIVQSYYKTYKKPYPVYATILCWEFVKSTFPKLKGMIEFKELVPYEKKNMDEVEGVELIPFPAYHGKSAIGASMLLFSIHDENKRSRVLFTGDILTPLLRKEDYASLVEIDLLIADANNRFPYPKSNHWSICDSKNTQIGFLEDFINQCSIGLLLEPHLKEQASDNYRRCFNYFLDKKIPISSFHFTMDSFVKSISPKKVVLVHYSGGEDEKYYNMDRLNEKELASWVFNNAKEQNIPAEFIIPKVGDTFLI